MKRIVIGAFSVLVLAGGAAQAQSPCCGYGDGWGNYYGFYGREHIPYYALHPPVYYSVPIPRTYGYSPFAYPPGTMTPEVQWAAEPQTMLNPFVPQKAKPAAEPEQTALRAKTILNPFVGQASEALAGPLP